MISVEHAVSTRFPDFNIDPDFSDCVDGLVLVNLNYLTVSKRRRYLGE